MGCVDKPSINVKVSPLAKYFARLSQGRFLRRTLGGKLSLIVQVPRGMSFIQAICPRELPRHREMPTYPQSRWPFREVILSVFVRRIRWSRSGASAVAQWRSGASAVAQLLSLLLPARHTVHQAAVSTDRCDKDTAFRRQSSLQGKTTHKKCVCL